MDCGNFIGRWFGSARYEAVHKKDDDSSKQLAQQWVMSHPVGGFGGLSDFTTQGIQTYVTRLIQDLRKVPIDSSNIDIIQSRLLEISAQSERVVRYIVPKLSDLDCDKTLISDLKFMLALVNAKKI